MRSIINKHIFDLLLLLIAVVLYTVSGYITFFILLLYLLMRSAAFGQIIKPDFAAILLFALLLMYCYNGITTGLVLAHNCIWIFSLSFLFFWVGKCIVTRCSNYTDFLFFLFFVFFILALRNIPITIYDIFVNGLVNPDRTIEVLDDGSESNPLTGRTIELSLAIAGICMLFFKSRISSDNSIRKGFIVVALISEVCALHYVSRTGIAVLIIALALGLLFKYGISIKTLVYVLIALVFAWVFSDSSLGSVFAEREIEGSSIADAGGRTERWGVGLAMLLTSPRGYTIDGFYAHNFWLDFGREGGAIAALLLITFSLYSLLVAVMLCNNKSLADIVRKPLLIYSFIFIITFFTEPVHIGAPMAMYIYFMFTGMIVQLNKLCKNENCVLRSF